MSFLVSDNNSFLCFSFMMLVGFHCLLLTLFLQHPAVSDCGGGAKHGVPWTVSVTSLFPRCQGAPGSLCQPLGPGAPKHHFLSHMSGAS